MLQCKRQLARDSSQKQQYLVARNSYFLAIKRAKRKHWNQFLEKEDPRSIYKAMAYTKDRQTERMPTISGQTSFQGKASTLRSTLFPPPPIAPNLAWSNYRPSTTWEWPELAISELENACSAKIKGKTPGPDSINQDIIRQAYCTDPDLFYRLFASLLNIGVTTQGITG